MEPPQPHPTCLGCGSKARNTNREVLISVSWSTTQVFTELALGGAKPLAGAWGVEDPEQESSEGLGSSEEQMTHQLLPSTSVAWICPGGSHPIFSTSFIAPMRMPV